MLPFCHEGIDEPLLNPIDDLIIRSPLIVNGGNCGEMGARSLHYHDYPNHENQKSKNGHNGHHDHNDRYPLCSEINMYSGYPHVIIAVHQ